MKIKYISALIYVLTLFASQIEANAQSISEDVKILASDSLQGRQSGDPSVEKSIRFIEKRFKEIGLTYHPKLNNYRQSFQFYTTFLADSASISADGIELEHRRHFYTTRFTNDTVVNAKVKLIENNILYQSIAEQKSINIAGKIALINIKEKPKKNATYTDSIYHYKKHIQYLTQHGASGIILMGEKVWYSDLVGKFAHIKTSIPVFYTFPDHKELALSLNEKVVEMKACLPKKQIGENILGFIDNKAKKTIVIGAHYDHLGIGYFGRSRDYKDSIYNGADDNASGVAGLLELAKMLKNENNCKHNYLFIALAAEERGLKGSWAFVHSKLFNKKQTLIYINYDMIGRMRKMRDKLFVIGTKSAQELPTIIKENKYKEGKLKNIKKTSTGSDHTPFYKNDIPILYFTTGLHGDYHTWKDDFKHINFEGIKYTVDYTYKIIKALDGYKELNFTPAKYMSIFNWIPMYLP
jgi:aminopeptidase YwaD